MLLAPNDNGLQVGALSFVENLRQLGTVPIAEQGRCAVTAHSEPDRNPEGGLQQSTEQTPLAIGQTTRKPSRVPPLMDCAAQHKTMQRLLSGERLGAVVVFDSGAR
jgi:hypothetical protein